MTRRWKAIAAALLCTLAAEFWIIWNSAQGPSPTSADLALDSAARLVPVGGIADAYRRVAASRNNTEAQMATSAAFCIQDSLNVRYTEPVVRRAVEMLADTLLSSSSATGRGMDAAWGRLKEVQAACTPRFPLFRP